MIHRLFAGRVGVADEPGNAGVGERGPFLPVTQMYFGSKELEKQVFVAVRCAAFESYSQAQTPVG
jgi:hypothetical protein